MAIWKSNLIVRTIKSCTVTKIYSVTGNLKYLDTKQHLLERVDCVTKWSSPVYMIWDIGLQILTSHGVIVILKSVDYLDTFMVITVLFLILLGCITRLKQISQRSTSCSTPLLTHIVFVHWIFVAYRALVRNILASSVIQRTVWTLSRPLEQSRSNLFPTCISRQADDMHFKGCNI